MVIYVNYLKISEESYSKALSPSIVLGVVREWWRAWRYGRWSETETWRWSSNFDLRCDRQQKCHRRSLEQNTELVLNWYYFILRLFFSTVDNVFYLSISRMHSHKQLWRLSFILIVWTITAVVTLTTPVTLLTFLMFRFDKNVSKEKLEERKTLFVGSWEFEVCREQIKIENHW